jgi:hypothetical protein
MFKCVCCLILLGILSYVLSYVLKCCSYFCLYSKYCTYVLIFGVCTGIIYNAVRSIPNKNELIRYSFVLRDFSCSVVIFLCFYRILALLSLQVKTLGDSFIRLAINLSLENKCRVFVGFIGFLNFNKIIEELTQIIDRLEDLRIIFRAGVRVFGA